MALSPSIQATAQRGALPSARFQSRAASGADFGGQIAAATQDLGQAVGRVGDSIEAFQLAKEADAKRLRNFERQANFIQFATAEQTRLADAQRNLAGGGLGFQADFVQTHAANAQAWMDANGITDEEDRAEWMPRLVQLRSSFSTEALGAEFGERDRFYREQTSAALNTFKTGINQNPDGYEGYLAQGEQLIDASGLSPAEKASRRADWRRQAAGAYGTALVQRDPAAAMAALGGPATVAGDASGDGTTGGAREDFSYFRSQGMSGVAAAAITGVLSWESGGGANGINPNGRNPGDGNDGSDSIGAAQWNGARAQALRAFARARGKEWNDRAVQREFVMHEMKTTEPEAYRRLQAATTIEQAVEAMSYYERPRGWRNGGDPTAVIHWSQRVDLARQFAGTTATETRPPEGAIDPRLADLAYEDRMSLLGAAGRGIQANIQEAARAQQDAYAEQINALELGLLDGDKGEADIAAAREAGWLTDATDVGRLQNIVQARARENADVNTFNALISDPNFVWNPVDDDQRKAVDAAFAAAPNMDTLQALVDRTGIMPAAAASQLRGGLLSTDPTRVRNSATQASNLLARNPNAFTPVEGHEQIERAAVMFNHLVNDLGFTPDEAGQRIATSNDPRNRERVRIGEPELQAFRTSLQRENPMGAIMGAVAGRIRVPGSVRVLARDQEAAIRQDYADLAADHFAQYGDAEAAQQFALRRMDRLYGVSNGTLVKYPPQNVYPAIEGNHDYLYEQARNAIQANTGRSIDAGQIYLMPIPTATAEAWRSGRLAPYSIHYNDEVDGQRVYRVLPGGFIADPTPAARRASEQRRRAFDEQARNNDMARRSRAAMRTGALPAGSIF